MPAKTRREQIEEMLALEPEDQFLRYALAMEHVSAGDDARAVELFQALIGSAADYLPAYFHGAQSLIRLGRGAEAKDLLQRGIQIARTEGDLHSAEEMAGLLGSITE